MLTTYDGVVSSKTIKYNVATG